MSHFRCFKGIVQLCKYAAHMKFNDEICIHFLLRITENYEYSELLDKAAQCNDIAEQLSYVAAFTVSSLSTTPERIAKPFNPLLGETYECDRTDDYGWRCINEQVSHHPPICAQFCESQHGWTTFQELQLTSKFWGKHIQILSGGLSRVRFGPISYTFNRPTTSCHNLIIGKLYIEHSGEATIVGEGRAAGWKCILSFQTHSFFSRDQRLVKGLVMDPSGNVKIILNAQWDDRMEMAPVISQNGDKYATGNSKVIWKRRPAPSDSYLYYNFTTFACQLNEMEYGIAPTDSRLRPDQRLMEDGRWDESNHAKVVLEEKQRDRRKLTQDVKPVWFSKSTDDATGRVIHQYNGNYWNHKKLQDWSQCASIF